MTPDSEDNVLKWAAYEPDIEVCGIVVDGEAHRMPNTSPTPSQSFSIEPGDLARLINSLPPGCDWSGVWHSHPHGTPVPSADDLMWHPPGKTLYIVAAGLVLAYEVVDGVAVRHRDPIEA